MPRRGASARSGRCGESGLTLMAVALFHGSMSRSRAAASLSHGDRWSEEVALVDMPGLDAIVCGSVAVTRDGRRCGKGEGYSGAPGEAGGIQPVKVRPT